MSRLALSPQFWILPTAPETGCVMYVVTVNTADENASVFRVTADYVNISGFTIQGATGGGTIAVAGINLEGADYCTFSNNNATGNLVGIALATSNHVTVTLPEKVFALTSTSISR